MATTTEVVEAPVRDRGDMVSVATHIEARQASRRDLPQVSRSLAAAFLDDPVLTWCYPDTARRRMLLPRVFAIITESALPGGEVYTTEDAVAGAVWIPPGVEEDPHVAAALGEVSEEYAPRLFQLLELMDAVHPRVPHHYLFVLGTTPEWQSRGIGSALMRPVLEVCDETRVPAYLEATSERNRDLYLRHSFDVTTTIQLPDGPSMWCMWREPDGSEETEH